MVDMEIAAEQDDAGIMDEGKAAHDEATINSVKGQAIEIGRGLGLLLSPGDEKLALGLFPRVSPLHFKLSNYLLALALRWPDWPAEYMTLQHYKRNLKNLSMPRLTLIMDRKGLLHDECLLAGTLIWLV